MVSVRAASLQISCPYCRSSLEETESSVRCFLCKTPHHDACWQINGSRCTVFQCPGNQKIIGTGGIACAAATRGWRTHMWVMLSWGINFAILCSLDFLLRILTLPISWCSFLIGIVVVALCVQAVRYQIQSLNSAKLFLSVVITVSIFLTIVWSCFLIFLLFLFASCFPLGCSD
jgi:hypothetical protein